MIFCTLSDSLLLSLLLLLLLLFTFQLHFRFLQYFTGSLSKIKGGERKWLYAFYEFVFATSSEWYIRSQWLYFPNEIRSSTKWILYSLGLPGIMLNYLYVLFIIIPRATTISDTIVVWRCYNSSVSISKCLYLIILLYSLTDKLLFVGTEISIRRHFS